MDYRRVRIAGGHYFFTVVTRGRRPLFFRHENVALLRRAFAHVKKEHPFGISACVILPDHLHCIWQLPEGDDDFPMRWRLVKHFVTRGSHSDGSIWQQRYWEHCIRDHEDSCRHLDYIHYNLVKHGLVDHPGAWPHSSFGHFVAKGWYMPEWGQRPLEFAGEYGE